MDATSSRVKFVKKSTALHARLAARARAIQGQVQAGVHAVSHLAQLPFRVSSAGADGGSAHLAVAPSVVWDCCESWHSVSRGGSRYRDRVCAWLGARSSQEAVSICSISHFNDTANL